MSSCVVIGNVVSDVELRFTSSGKSVTSFSVAENRRPRRDSEETIAHYFDVTCWDSLADNAAASLTRGMRVVVVGRMDQVRWENDKGEKRSRVEVVADEIGPSIRWASATVAKNERNGS